jgi:translation initiation factor 2 subunit 1
VVKILKIDPEKMHIDCSLRRVSNESKRAKNNEWKRAQKAEKILELVAKENDMTLEQVYEKLGWPIEEVFGEIYTGLERAADGGVEILDEVQATKKLKKQVADFAAQRIEIPSVEIDGELTIAVPGPEGVEVIKKALTEGLAKGKSHEKSTTEIYSLGSPRYKLRIVSPDYKEAEEILSEVISLIQTQVEHDSGTVSFAKK